LFLVRGYLKRLFEVSGFSVLEDRSTLRRCIYQYTCFVIKLVVFKTELI